MSFREFELKNESDEFKQESSSLTEDIDQKSDSDEQQSDSDIHNKKKKKKKNKKINILKMNKDAMDWIEEFKESHVDEKPKKEIKNLPWIEKFRPNTLSDVISHENIISALNKLIQKKQFPHLLLSGPPGTGKTSTIMACARELYKENYSLMVLEINASEERGIEVIRNKVREFISTKGVFLANNTSMFKLVILDEADAMTSDAQALLVNVIEKFTHNVRFCLICNYIKKINPLVQSRCITFKFSPLNKENISIKLKNIADQLHIKLEQNGIDTIIKISRGDMRRVLNIFQATSMAYNIVNSINVTKCIGYPSEIHMQIIYNDLIKKKFDDAYNDINSLISKNGYCLTDIITELTDIIINNFINKKISQQDVIVLLSKMKNIEMNLTMCPNESIQLMGLVGLFKLVW